MRLALLDSGGNYGGVEKWMLTTARNFRERGHHCYFCGRPNSTFMDLVTEAQFDSLQINMHSDFSPINIWRLSEFFRRHDIEIVIANLNKSVRLGGLASKLCDTNIVVARHGLPMIDNSWRYRVTYEWLVDGIITPNRAIKQHYMTFGWMDSDYIKVVHNGIDSSLPVTFDRQEVLKQHGIPDNGEPIVGIFGRLAPQKQHQLFLDMAQSILADRPHTRFIIVGDGPLHGEIRQHAADLGISKSVYMLGYQKQVLPLYSVTDIVVQTSEHEGLPNVVLEGMFAGKPVVSFDVGGVRELIPGEEYGIVLPLNDIVMMKRATTDLLDSPDRRHQLGDRARQRILTEFTVERMVNRVESYLLSLIEKKRPHHRPRELVE